MGSAKRWNRQIFGQHEIVCCYVRGNCGRKGSGICCARSFQNVVSAECAVAEFIGRCWSIGFGDHNKKKQNNRKTHAHNGPEIRCIYIYIERHSIQNVDCVLLIIFGALLFAARFFQLKCLLGNKKTAIVVSFSFILIVITQKSTYNTIRAIRIS